MKVPAWPMPIHQTVFAMAKPHATGMLTPQMPGPSQNRYAIAPRYTSKPMKVPMNASSQGQRIGRVSTESAMRSLMLP